MNDKAIRTQNKNLLLGVLSYRNNKWYIVIQSRGKEDIIEVENLIKILYENM